MCVYSGNMLDDGVEEESHKGLSVKCVCVSAPSGRASSACVRRLALLLAVAMEFLTVGTVLSWSPPVISS